MINFREMQDTEEDYRLLLSWFSNPEVFRWYGQEDFPDGVSLDLVKEKYRLRCLRADAVTPAVIEIDGRPAGYIQYYKTDDCPGASDVWGIDLFIGEDDFRDRGYGTAILNKMTGYLFQEKKAGKIILDPEQDNKRAIRCYEKAGFIVKGRIGEHQLLMVLEKNMQGSIVDVCFYDEVSDSLLKYAVIVSRFQGQWLFCKHKNRSTYECPGGHREPGEDILATARRELYEETGARKYSLKPVCVYSVVRSSAKGADRNETFGLLCYAEIYELSELPAEFEMERITLFTELPDAWTYPEIQPRLMAKIMETVSL